MTEHLRIEAVIFTVLEAGKATARRWHLLRLLLAQVSLPLLKEPLMPSWGPLPHDLIYLPLPSKIPPPNTINSWMWGVHFWHMSFGGH
jgi:hypothetical protein